jgi:hypothetical protein
LSESRIHADYPDYADFSWHPLLSFRRKLFGCVQDRLGRVDPGLLFFFLSESRIHADYSDYADFYLSESRIGADYTDYADFFSCGCLFRFYEAFVGEAFFAKVDK